MSVAIQSNFEDDQSFRAAFAPFPTTPQVPDNDVCALITDFFKWLEADWRFPTFLPETTLPALPQPLALTEEVYTAKDLALLYGHSYSYVCHLLHAQNISPLAGGKGGRSAVYKKPDLVSVIKQCEWNRIYDTLNHWWLRFFPPACEACSHCQRPDLTPLARRFNCRRSAVLTKVRSITTNFLEEVHFLDGVATWWCKHGAPVWTRSTCAAWGIILIYLLDRRLIQLSDDELLQLEPICNRDSSDLTRLWRNRCPEEYEQFQKAIKAANYRGATKRAEMIFSLFVLLKYGLRSIGELRRPLSSEEIQQVCSEGRLVTHHLGHGFYLPYPLTADIRVGHVVLDSIRRYFWQYTTGMKRNPRKQCRDRGPRNWEPMDVSVIEQALAAPIYEGGEGILSRRPETEHNLHNPWHITYKGELSGNAYGLLPLAVQEHIKTYLMYCLQHLQLEITTAKGKLATLINFFVWVGNQGKLASYPHWTRQYAEDIFRTYISVECAGLKASTRRSLCKRLAHFFLILADLGYPVPEGFRIWYTFVKEDSRHPRAVPREEILDRVFREGVCHLSYDPFARLALTIQYYCGTRITETLDMHLLCVLQNAQGDISLLIPKGKSKQERPFPIVKLGMGTLLTYMDEIIKLRLTPDGTTSRTLGKTNLRYLDDNPELAMDWQYLFDRVPSHDSPVKMRGRLSCQRVRQALGEALLMATRINSDGLFQPGTYHSDCRRQRKKWQYCYYFAAQEGITACPCCGSPLSGQRGARCRHILEEDFKCDGVAQHGEVFCPKCDAPLATFLPISPHVFRHNSVSRAHRAGVSLAQNMKLHGHQTIPMHLRYLHLFLEDAVDEVERVFAEKRLREVILALGTASGQIVEGGIAHSVSLENYLGITLQRLLKRRTLGIWGGFWAGALAQQGVASPTPTGNDIVILEDTYEHTAAQYWYEALGLAVSEVAFERVTQGKWRAEIPPFLDRQKIEDLVRFYLRAIQDSLETTLGMKLMETDIREQRQFLDKLAEMLHPWWKHQGSIDALIEMFAPGGGHVFQKQLPPAESES